MDKSLKIEGSCHCGAIKFSADSYCYYPFMICHCKLDRKTTGFNCCNISAMSNTLKIHSGEEHLSFYRALVGQTERHPGEPEKKSTDISTNKRYYCRLCATYLYSQDSRWAEWIYPFSNCLDTELPVVPEEEQYHIMLDYKASHTKIPDAVVHKFNRYPNISLLEWHKQKQQKLNEQKK